MRTAQVLNMSKEEFEAIKPASSHEPFHIYGAYQLLMTQIAKKSLWTFDGHLLNEKDLKERLKIVWGSILKRFDMEGISIPYEQIEEVLNDFYPKGND